MTAASYCIRQFAEDACTGSEVAAPVCFTGLSLIQACSSLLVNNNNNNGSAFANITFIPSANTGFMSVSDSCLSQPPSAVYPLYNGSCADGILWLQSDECAVVSAAAVPSNAVLALISFFAVWVFIVWETLPFPVYSWRDRKWSWLFLHLERPLAALVGAMLMVLTGIVSQTEALAHLGQPNLLKIIFLLIGMMIFEYYIRRENVLSIPLGLISGRTRWAPLDRVFGTAPSVARVLWTLMPVAALIGGLITNDAVCILLAPLVLDELTQFPEFTKEALTAIVIGLPMAANIGSTWTVIGNPQIAYIVSQTGIEFARYLKHMLFSTIFVLILHIALLHTSYRYGLFSGAAGQQASFAPLQNTEDDDNSTDASHIDADNPSHESLELADLGAEIASDNKPVNDAPKQYTRSAWWTPPFVSLMMIVTVALLLIPPRYAYFDLGLVPFAAGFLTASLYFKVQVFNYAACLICKSGFKEHASVVYVDSMLCTVTVASGESLPRAAGESAKEGKMKI